MGYDYLMKVVMVGDTGVGKSSLLIQFTENTFDSSQAATIGVEFGTNILDVDDKQVKLQIWDTAGQEAFRSLTRSYYRGTCCAILVYDITSKNSFAHLKDWLDEARDNGPETMIFLVIGNKIDSEDDRQVTFEDGRLFAEENGTFFTETSAKTGDHVTAAFQLITKTICDKISNGEIDVDVESCGIRKGDPPAKDTSVISEDKPKRQVTKRTKQKRAPRQAKQIPDEKKPLLVEVDKALETAEVAVNKHEAKKQASAAVTIKEEKAQEPGCCCC